MKGEWLEDYRGEAVRGHTGPVQAYDKDICPQEKGSRKAFSSTSWMAWEKSKVEESSAHEA